MGTLAVGQVIVLPFPFSDLQKKIRPALLLASVGRGDWIVCQITSKAYFDALAIGIAGIHNAELSLGYSHSVC